MTPQETFNIVAKHLLKTKFVQIVAVIDPDSGLPVEVEIRKLETGGMVGIDGSWLESDEGPTYSPYDRGVELVIPDDEQDASNQYDHCASPEQRGNNDDDTKGFDRVAKSPCDQWQR